jgi:hypothetical protein
MRKRDGTGKPPIGRDAYRVMDGKKVLAEEGNAMVALLAAQQLAQKTEEADYVVERETLDLKGSIVQLYRVKREGKVVTTEIINEED